MGGEQAFQWAVSHPEFTRRVVVTSATAKCYPHRVVRLESQIQAIVTDPAFKGGDYTAQPEAGLSAFGMVWAPWLYSQEWWRRELWKADELILAWLQQADIRGKVQSQIAESTRAGAA